MDFDALVTTSLCQLFTRKEYKLPNLPLDSFSLLRYLIVTCPESAQDTQRLRLTDRRAFNSQLRKLAIDWDRGTVILSGAPRSKNPALTDDEQDVDVLSIQIRNDTPCRKRKRDQDSPGTGIPKLHSRWKAMLSP